MFTKLVRLSKNPEMGTTKTGTAMCRVGAVYNVGWGDNKTAVWCDFAAFGKVGERIAQHCQKGSQLVLTISDVAPQGYQKKDGTIGTSLGGKILDFEFGPKADQQQGQPMSQPMSQPMAQPQTAQFQQPAAQQFAPTQQPQAAHFSNPAPVEGYSDEDIPF